MKKIMVQPKITFIPFLILSFFTGLFLISEYRISYQLIKEVSERYLEEAIYVYSSEQMETRTFKRIITTKQEDYEKRIRLFEQNNYNYNHYEDSILFFKEDNEWDYRTFFGNDTIFNKKVKKKKHVFTTQLTDQSTMIQLGIIEPDSILAIFKKRLNESKGIKLYSPIYLSVTTELDDTIHFSNFKNLSEIQYNYILPPLKTGYLDEITYTAYLNLNFKTVYNNMPKGFLTQLYILCLISLFYFLWRFTKDCYDKSHTEIVCLDPTTHRYKLGHVLFIYEKQQLYYKKEFKMNYKTTTILLKLLQSEDYTLSKKTVEELCTGGSNMTSHMNMVRSALKKSTCRYTVTNFKKTGYYKLELDKQPFVENKMDDVFRVWEEAKGRLPEKIKKWLKI